MAPESFFPSPSTVAGHPGSGCEGLGWPRRRRRRWNGAGEVEEGEGKEEEVMVMGGKWEEENGERKLLKKRIEKNNIRM